MGIVWGQIHLHQGRIAQNAHEKIVEIMGHTTGKGADGLHLFRMLKMVFEPLSIRNVSQGSLDDGLAPLIFNHGGGSFGMEGRSVLSNSGTGVGNPVERIFLWNCVLKFFLRIFRIFGARKSHRDLLIRFSREGNPIIRRFSH
jgi:hypothetical protein